MSMGSLSCLLRMLRSAPLCSSRLTISTCPRMAAQCSGVFSPCQIHIGLPSPQLALPKSLLSAHQDCTCSHGSQPSQA